MAPPNDSWGSSSRCATTAGRSVRRAPLLLQRHAGGALCSCASTSTRADRIAGTGSSHEASAHVGSVLVADRFIRRSLRGARFAQSAMPRFHPGPEANQLGGFVKTIDRAARGAEKQNELDSHLDALARTRPACARERWVAVCALAGLLIVPTRLAFGQATPPPTSSPDAVVPAPPASSAPASSASTPSVAAPAPAAPAPAAQPSPPAAASSPLSAPPAAAPPPPPGSASRARRPSFDTRDPARHDGIETRRRAPGPRPSPRPPRRP